MDRLIVEHEEQLSPVVLITTGVLGLVFLLGVAYFAAGTLL